MLTQISFGGNCYPDEGSGQGGGGGGGGGAMGGEERTKREERSRVIV